jgi:hypothetical protein
MMMKKTNPITPPPELMEQLCNSPDNWRQQLTNAYQAGADMELEACCEWLYMNGSSHLTSATLRAARRPKPPSLRKQAYDALDTYIYGEPDPKDKERTYNTIRRALEALDD